MMGPLVADLAADGIPVAVTCRVLGFSTQAYYARRRNPVSQRDWDDALLINAALDIHHDDPAFGYRFIADELHACGIAAGINRVARLCSRQRIWSVFAKKRGLTRRPGPPVHDDLVNKVFSAGVANAVWLTDITEHPDRRGQAVPVRDQGCVLRSDRRLLDRLADESLVGDVRIAQRGPAPRAGGHRGALGSR
jgi:putative transposase